MSVVVTGWSRFVVGTYHDEEDEAAAAAAAAGLPLVPAETHAYVDERLDAAYIAALERHNAALVRAARGELTLQELGDLAPAAEATATDGTAEVEDREAATDRRAVVASASPLQAARIHFECFCAQPSPVMGGVGGEGGCRHSELRLETTLWAMELTALFRDEARSWDRDIAAPAAAFCRRLAKEGGPDAAWKRRWRDAAVRDVVDTLAAEDAAGRQLRFQ